MRSFSHAPTSVAGCTIYRFIWIFTDTCQNLCSFILSIPICASGCRTRWCRLARPRVAPQPAVNHISFGDTKMPLIGRKFGKSPTDATPRRNRCSYAPQYIHLIDRCCRTIRLQSQVTLLVLLCATICEN